MHRAQTMRTPVRSVIVYAPQGAGKSEFRSATLAHHFKLSLVVLEADQREDQDIPRHGALLVMSCSQAEAVAHSARLGLRDPMTFHEAMRQAAAAR